MKTAEGIAERRGYCICDITYVPAMQATRLRSDLDTAGRQLEPFRNLFSIDRADLCSIYYLWKSVHFSVVVPPAHLDEDVCERSVCVPNVIN